MAASDPAFVASLAPGLSESEVQARVSSLGLVLPVEAVTWFGWHNATIDAARGRSFITCTPFAFLSLDQAAEMCASYREGAASIAEEMGCTEEMAGWGRSWFPLVAGASGNVAAIDCSVPAGERSPVRETGKADEDPTKVDADSLTTVIEWWLAAHRSGIYAWTPEHGWQSEDERLPPEQRRTKLV